MNIRNILQKFIFFGSVIYTVISTGMIILAILMTDAQYSKMLDAKRFLYILLFSFILSLGSTLLRVEEISRVAAVCIHAACYVLGFFIFVILCGIEFAPAVIATVVFAVIYAVFTAICRLVSRSFSKAGNETKQIKKQPKEAKTNNKYTSQFTK